MSSLNDRRDFEDLKHAMKVLGFEAHEQDTLWKLVAVVLHLVGCSVVGVWTLWYHLLLYMVWDGHLWLMICIYLVFFLLW